MNGSDVSVYAALVVQIGLGIVVLWANPKRTSNQCFFILCLVIAGWLTTLHFAFTATTAGIAETAIREASVAGAFILTCFNLLRLSIRERRKGWKGIIGSWDSRFWLAATLGIAVFCHTKLFLVGAQMPAQFGMEAPIPIWGVAHRLYDAFLFGGLLLILVFTVLDLRRDSGGERAELAFIIIGGTSMVLITVLGAYALDYFVGQSRALLFAPFRTFLFTLVIGYGIATRKVMDVGLFIRRLISYSLLTGYLLALYCLVWWLVEEALNTTQFTNAATVAHITAGLVVAFAMAPARGASRRLAERLFISSQRIDFQATVSKATEIVASITTLQDLLQRFAGTIAEAVAAERVGILLPHRDKFAPGYVFSRTGRKAEDCSITAEGPIVSYLQTHREPVVLEELYRMRPTPLVTRLCDRMRELEVAVAIGVFSREHLAGIMLLGPRMSGRIYGTVEQNALQVLCGQLAVAIDNAQLFTEVQNAKIYNETLLQNLTTGVIAAGTDEQITVFNNEAGQITGLDPAQILDQPLDRLPAPVCAALRTTLQTGQSQEHVELALSGDRDGVTVRVSTSIFHGQDPDQVLGALLVLTDVTALKRLESQIRRSDRLASLGTLSAGMAHEIKNPLVSIKTFAQLLPERYNDSEFRDTFSNLIGHEIDRIDSLVNQLLRFARPTKPHLQPMHVHDILEKSLLLVGHRLYQKDIKLTRSLGANVDTIRADSDQLEQVFLNFFINAMDAMKNGGELHISTEVRTDEKWISPLTQTNGESHEFLRVTIRDNGEGIRREDLAHVFDPFFTTKDYGTGLGLSVVHGIVQEHGGHIEVESELKKGTAFHILLPLVRFDSKVAAA